VAKGIIAAEPSPHEARKLVMCIEDGQGSARQLAASTINRALAAVSSFYEYLIVSGLWTEAENPILKQYDSQQARVVDRHRRRPPSSGSARLELSRSGTGRWSRSSNGTATAWVSENLG
jgi:hypothetical protein